jgi:hypothetical protein
MSERQVHGTTLDAFPKLLRLETRIGDFVSIKAEISTENEGKDFPVPCFKSET